MQKVAADEAHHYKLYCTLMGAGHELWPDAAMIAVWEQVRRFAMPGEGIEDFDAHSAAISDVGIFVASNCDRSLRTDRGGVGLETQPGSAPTPSGPGRGSSSLRDGAPARVSSR